MGKQHKVQRLLDSCLQVLIRNFEVKSIREKIKSHQLPGISARVVSFVQIVTVFLLEKDELTLKLIELLSKRRRLTDETLEPFLHPRLRTLDLTNCQGVSVSLVSICFFLKKRYEILYI
jgi:hypothetical protein